MNKTPEQWTLISPKHIAEYASMAHVWYLVEAAQQDIAELLRDSAQLQFALEQSEQKWLKAQQGVVMPERHALMHWSESMKGAWPVEPEAPEGAWMVGSIDDDGDQTFYPVITVEADQYDAPGDSEKIAKAISALWQHEFSRGARLNGAGVVDGWKLVPIEPTEDMQAAGQASGKGCAFSYAACYRAMLTAAPALEVVSHD